MATQFPFNRDVNQIINPWNWFTRIVGSGQLGLINIVVGRTSKPELEEEILDRVGSYGRQIGRLADALDAVLKHMDTQGWDPEGQKALLAFQAQLYEVRSIKDHHTVNNK